MPARRNNHPAWGTTPVPTGEMASHRGHLWRRMLGASIFDGNLEALNGAVTTCPAATPEFTSIQHAGLVLWAIGLHLDS